MARKIIYKVDINGKEIKNLKKWKILNPRKVYFDSKFERFCYLALRDAGFNFEFHPPSRELVSTFQTCALSKNKKGPKKLFKSTVRPLSYTTDFAVFCNDGTTVYIEAKGFFHPDARLRYKLFQLSLEKDEVSLLAYDKGGSDRDIKSIIRIINDNFGGSDGGKVLKKEKAPKITEI